MLPRSRRVSTRLVKEIVSTTRPLHGRFLYIRYAAAGAIKGDIDEKAIKNSLFSVIVPKSVEKSSVGRHRLKRRISEALRNAMISWPKGVAVIVFVKDTAKKAERAEIAEDGMSLLNKIKV